MTLEDYDAAQAMLAFGGSFVHALGEAFMAADPQNQARLRAAFPDYFAHYTKRWRRELAKGVTARPP